MKLNDLPLSTRIAASALVLVALAGMILVFVEEAHYRGVYFDERRVHLEETFRINESRLTQAVGALRRNALFLSHTPPVAGIVRAAANNGYDNRDGNTQERWTLRMQQIFSAFTTVHPDYHQMSFIGVAGRVREMARVTRRRGQAWTVPLAALQAGTIVDYKYYSRALELRPGQVHLSDIVLCRERGADMEAAIPTLYAAVPVFDASGKVFGLVVLGLDMRSLLQGAGSGLPKEVSTFVSNGHGQYLLHPDMQSVNASACSTDIRRDFPQLAAVLDPRSPSFMPLRKSAGASPARHLTAGRIHYNPEMPAQFILLTYQVAGLMDRGILAIPKFHIAVGFAVLVLVCAIMLVVLRRIFSPLKQIATAAEAITAGGRDLRLPAGGGGEIGSLGTALNAMLNELSRREQEIVRINEGLEQEVARRTQELTVTNDLLVKEMRERERILQDTGVLLQRYRVLMKTATDGIHILDMLGNVVEANDAFCAMLGYSREELSGLNVADWDAHFSREELQTSFKNLVGENVLIESRHRRKDGTLIDVEIGVTGLDFEGRAVIFAASRDITERKQAEEVLRRKKVVIETAMDGFWITDANGNLLEANEAYARMSGYAPAELPGMHISQLEAKEQPEDIREHIAMVLEQGYDRFETRHRHKDGHEIDIEVSARYLAASDQIFVFCRDVTERKRSALALEHKQYLLDEAQRLGKMGSWEIDLQSGTLQWSDEVYRIFELDPERFLPSYENFLYVIHPDDREKVNRAYTRSLQDKKPYNTVHRLRFADGRIKWLREHCSTDFDASGRPLRSVGMVQDISEQKEAEEALRVAAATFETHDAIVITDASANIIRVNRAFSDITGYAAEEVLGKNPRIMNSGRHDREFFVDMWQLLTLHGSWVGEIWDRRKNGEVYPKWMTITAVKNEEQETTEYVAIFSDITERKKVEAEIYNLAFYDPLTGLPNRRLLVERFRMSLHASARHGGHGAVLFIDLDRFKVLNDTMGHEYGDLMLEEVGRRLKSVVREIDTVSRLGGDEFIVLLENIGGDQDAAASKAGQVAEKIRLALVQPYLLNGYEHHSSPSIGICLYRGNRETVDTLIQHADLAMYEAKKSGRNALRFFDPVMLQNVARNGSEPPA